MDVDVLVAEVSGKLEASDSEVAAVLWSDIYNREKAKYFDE